MNGPVRSARGGRGSWVRRGLLVLGGLLLLLLVALAIVLPRIAASDAVRARLADAVSDAAGLPFRYATLEAGLLPVRLELREVELGYEGAEPAARAERVELRIALLPLLGRTVLVDALVVQGASAQLVRRDGRLRLRGAEEEAPKEPKAPRVAEVPRESRDEFAFAVRSARVSDTRLAFEDDDGARLSAGPLSADFSLGATQTEPTGPFALDLGDAEIRYRSAGSEEDSFTKPPGIAARLGGVLALAADGSAEVTSLGLDLSGLSARGTAAFAERANVTLDAPRFELASLAALVPGAADTLGGRAALRELSFTTEPPTLAGAVELAPVTWTRDGRHLELEGRLDARGDRLVGTALTARLAGFEVPLDLSANDLFGDPRVILDVTLEDADSAALVSALADRDDVLSGPLDLVAHVEAAVREPLATLGGELTFGIAPGRLRGVSFLRSAVESAGLLGSAALAAGEEEGDRLGRFYDDEFESLGGSVQIRGGVAHTDDLRLVYRHYGVDLRGEVVLDGLALDMNGTLTIDEELDAALQGEAGKGRRRVIPLARVGGTVAAPSVQLTPEAIQMIAGAYATERRREKWESKIDKYLGEGSGRELLDALLSGPSEEPTEPERDGNE
jgi:hypothetical protein